MIEEIGACEFSLWCLTMRLAVCFSSQVRFGFMTLWTESAEHGVALR